MERILETEKSADRSIRITYGRGRESLILMACNPGRSIMRGPLAGS
ncbi:hypothetical protein C7408_1166 [Paraburkholderia caballeronis]|uniref:Uncharacterized protein n=1 Tax=Paraburkholderia caballeronis TaxID=416943 RepID=A0A1H7VB27_9BURK|nr:hypothetical protein C7403_12271 [Paraburkholderia caballeronis]PXW94225.1 hypothetical protein C7407_1226 [Paraburkholderia caballeronis]RAJ89748.1 hypothetical protein C7409_12271 [Paraburkholderia caballeronis]TDV09185.1 hypothetical protein C7408_1166 [Paraburkholderia caballeronis]TDV12245.1 hypothetical protein C7406_1176 [Paraburkholderia caballeronis]